MKNELQYSLFEMVNKGYALSKSKCQIKTFNLTRGDEKIMVRQGWMDNKSDWFATPVTDHGVNGKIKGETKIFAEWSQSSASLIK